MKAFYPKGMTQIAFSILGLMVLHLTVWMPNASAEGQKAPLASEERLRLGERMYRSGILPSGERMRTVSKEGTSIPGTTYSCVGCHLRSGLGSIDDGIVTPATTGSDLFKPNQMRYQRFGSRPSGYFRIPIERPAYTDETLAAAIRTGVDPGGRVLDEVMPRFILNDDEMSVLISYLKTLSSRISPGITDTSLKLATVITDDIPQREREAMLAPLTEFITTRNNKIRYLSRLAETGDLRIHMAGKVMPPPLQAITLSPWLLKGPPQTWRGQLEEYYRNEPVFALIGGRSGGEWKPIHRFCEENRIPCLFPDTDFPVINRTDWYTMYLSKGIYEEGEAAARYLNDAEPITQGGAVLQIVRDSPQGEALSRGFQETWHDLGHAPPVTLTLKTGERLTAGELGRLLGRQKTAALLLWDGPAAPSELETVAAVRDGAEMVFVSASYLSGDLWSIKEQHRGSTYIAYPFRLKNNYDPLNQSQLFSAGVSKQVNQAYAIKEVLTNALADMKGEYYRDNFLDVIGSMEDFEAPLYERLTFGPGQRYASNGCYIVQLSKGEKPVLVQKGNWVTDGAR